MKQDIYEIPLDFFKAFDKVQAERSFRIYKKKKFDEKYLIISLCEEIGELAGYRKKEERDGKNHRKEKGKECADILMYLMMYCRQQKFDLGKLLVDKFNEVSKRKKSSMRIKAKK